MEKKTPLYDTHLKYGGKIVEFGGFLLPVQYGSGVKAEHMAVRTQCGLFDVSHMGEVLVQGEKAKDFLNLLLTNDYTDLEPGFARYSPMCNEHGGTVDDLIVYMKGENDYFVVVNAANTDTDFAGMCDHKIDGVELKTVSDDLNKVALKGHSDLNSIRIYIRKHHVQLIREHLFCNLHNALYTCSVLRGDCSYGAHAIYSASVHGLKVSLNPRSPAGIAACNRKRTILFHPAIFPSFTMF